jgi:hypothetical protein
MWISITLAEHVARMREMRNGYELLVGIIQSEETTRRPRLTWEDNITSGNGSYRNSVESCGLDVSGYVSGPVADSCGQSSKPSDSVKKRVIS